jgi:hypothetical protein
MFKDGHKIPIPAWLFREVDTLSDPAWASFVLDAIPFQDWCTDMITTAYYKVSH